MRVIKAACVGAGNRGCIYSDFALSRPDLMKLVAVVDPDERHRNDLADRHGIAPDMRFSSVEDFVRCAPECDLVINATMDDKHCEVAAPLLKAGYDMLIEKPITACPDELISLRKEARELGRKEGVDQEIIDTIEPLSGVDISYIMSAINAIEKTYGSLDGFFKNGLGIDEGYINELRQNYLE